MTAAERQHKAYPKAERWESKPYRRLVAGLPCRACGMEGYSQAAHVPASGKQMKESDTELFPLCCTRPGIVGCHYEFDQYIMFPAQEARAIGRQWARETRGLLGLKGE